MRMQTGIKLKKLNFKFNRTTNVVTVILIAVVHVTVGRSDSPRVVVAVGAVALGRRPIKSIFISAQTFGIEQRK